MTSEHNIVDYEEVLRVLPESFQDKWKDNPDVLVYLSDLGALGLQRLSQEPDRLAEEKTAVLEQTQDLAFHNYKTFIQAAECSHKIFQDFNIIESRLDSLLNKLPLFKEKCCEFGKEAQQINARWHQASSTLAKHPQLVEFLEMPQLMDNYVKSGFYDEALELSTYVKRLERKHVDIPLINSIVSDVQQSANSMLVQLLSKLRANIQLPECLKVVGYLRRMDVFNESELRIKFLQARDTWFQKVINEIDKSDPYQHVIKVIENSRIHLFDIITQYRAIFSDDDPLLLVRDNSRNNCGIFHSWISWKISWFLCVLQNDISSNLGGRIDSVLAQCMYFGLSFSRVNIDFRPLLIRIFQNAVFQKFQTELERATLRFEKTMKSYILSVYTNTTLLVPTVPEESLQPPSSLLDFHPLAQYCNDVLSALNELKLCSSFAMSSDVTTAISESLRRLVKTLVEIHNKKKHSMTDLENEHFIKFCFLLSSDLVPHFNKCLYALFPHDEICHILGITSLEFKKVEYLCKLNSKNILEPLADILPSKDDIEEDDMGLTLTFKANNASKTKEIKSEKLSENNELDLQIQCSEIEELQESEKIDSTNIDGSDNIRVKSVDDFSFHTDTQNVIDINNSNAAPDTDENKNISVQIDESSHIESMNAEEGILTLASNAVTNSNPT